jgi:hypothetical protein
MSTFRQIGARAKTQGGGSFTNMTISNQIVAAQPMTIIANAELTENVGFMLENDTNFMTSVSDTVTTNLTANGPFAERLSVPVKVFVAQRLLSDPAFSQSLSGPVKLLVASQLLEDPRTTGFMASVQNKLKNNAEFIDTLATPIQQAVADQLDGDPAFINILLSNLESNATLLSNLEFNLKNPLKISVGALLLNDTEAGGFVPTILSNLQSDSSFVSNLSGQVFGPSGTTGFVQTIASNLSENIQGNTGLWDGLSTPVQVAIARTVATQLLEQSGPTGFSSIISSQIFGVSGTTGLASTITNNLIQTIQSGTGLWGQLSTPVQMAIANTVASQLLSESGPTGFSSIISSQIFGASGTTGLASTITNNLIQTIQSGTGLWGQLSPPVQMAIANTVASQLLAQSGPTGFSSSISDQIFGTSGTTGLASTITADLIETIQSDTGLWGQLTNPVQIAIANTVATQLLTQSGPTGFSSSISTQLFGASGPTGLASTITTDIIKTIQSGTGLWSQLSNPVQLAIANTVAFQLLAQSGPTGFSSSISNQIFGASGPSGLANNVISTIQGNTGVWNNLSAPVKLSLSTALTTNVGTQLLAQTGPTGFSSNISNTIFGASGLSGLANDVANTVTNIVTDTIRGGVGLWNSLNSDVKLTLATALSQNMGTQLLAQSGPTGFSSGISSALFGASGPSGLADNVISTIQGNTGIWNNLSAPVKLTLATALSQNMGTQLLAQTGPTGFSSSISSQIFGASGPSGLANTVTSNIISTIQENTNVWNNLSSDVKVTLVSALNDIALIEKISKSFKIADNVIFNNFIVPLFEVALNPNTSVSINVNPTLFQTSPLAATWTYYKFLLVDGATTLSTADEIIFPIAVNSQYVSGTYTYSNSTLFIKKLYFCIQSGFTVAAIPTTHLRQITTGFAYLTYFENIVTDIVTESIDMLQIPLIYSGPTSTLDVYNASEQIAFSIPAATNVDTGFIFYSQGVAHWSSKLTNASVYEFARSNDNSINVIATSNGASTISSSDPSNTILSTPRGLKDCILIKYNPAGYAQWVATIGSITVDEKVGDVTVDNNDNILITGNKSNTSAVGNEVIAYNSDGTAYATVIDSTTIQNINSFIVRYNSNGFVQGIAALKGPQNQFINDIHINKLTNEIYLAVECSVGATLFLTNGTVDQAGIVGTTRGAGYILKLSAIGDNSVPIWWATNNTTATSFIQNVKTDSNNNVYALHYINGDTAGPLYLYDANDITTIKITVANTTVNGLMFSKYNSSGIVQWGFNLVSFTMFSQQLCSFVIDQSDNIYIYLRMRGATTINDINNMNLTTTYPSTSYDCGYVIKYSSAGVYQTYAQIYSAAGNIIPFFMKTFRNRLCVHCSYTGQCNVNYGTNATTTKTFGAIGNNANIILQFDESLTPSLIGYGTI